MSSLKTHFVICDYNDSHYLVINQYNDKSAKNLC